MISKALYTAYPLKRVPVTADTTDAVAYAVVTVVVTVTAVLLLLR